MKFISEHHHVLVIWRAGINHVAKLGTVVLVLPIIVFSADILLIPSHDDHVLMLVYLLMTEPSSFLNVHCVLNLYFWTLKQERAREREREDRHCSTAA